MGIVPSRSGVVSLADTSSNLSAVLGQLTRGQLCSFDQIVSTDGQPLDVDIATLFRLDDARSLNSISWASNRGGLDVVDTSNNTLGITLQQIG